MFTLNYTEIAGLKTHYIQKQHSKEAPNLFVLHGWGGSIKTWANFLELLKDDPINIIMVDLPGFGKTDIPKSAWTVDDYTEFVKKAVDQFQIHNLHLLGHSFGGQIAANYAGKHHLKSLFLIGAAAIRHPDTLKKKILRVFSKMFKFIFKNPNLGILKKLVYKIIGATDYYNASSDPIMKEIIKNVLATDLQDLLPNIKAPTTIVWGRHDTYTPLRDGKLIAKLISNSKIHILENARHGIHLQEPKKLRQIILEQI